MVVVIRKPENVLKEAYEKLKFRNECYEVLADRLQKEVNQLKEENNAYKVLLKDKLDKEEKANEIRRSNKAM